MHTRVNKFIDDFWDYDRWQRHGATESELVCIPKQEFGTTSEPGVIRYFFAHMGEWAKYYQRRLGDKKLKEFKSVEEFCNAMRAVNDSASQEGLRFQEISAGFTPFDKLDTSTPAAADIFEQVKKERVRVSLHALEKNSKQRARNQLDSEDESAKSEAQSSEHSDTDGEDLETEQARYADSLAALLNFNKPKVTQDTGRKPLDATQLKLMPCFAKFKGDCPRGSACPYSHDPKILQAHGERVQAKKALARKA
jgi:hypothetical protein